MPVSFAHINIIARDWKKLSDFYIKVFCCRPVPPERNLEGAWIEDATGIKGVKIQGIHLALPGFDEKHPVTIEIFQYNHLKDESKSINRTGFSHIAFKVEDVAETLEVIIENGGSAAGKIVRKEIAGAGIITFVYAADPEGNIIELQKWE
jgi:predicted enzyme related to lactoylglutathione lyase